MTEPEITNPIQHIISVLDLPGRTSTLGIVVLSPTGKRTFLQDLI